MLIKNTGLKAIIECDYPIIAAAPGAVPPGMTGEPLT